MVSVLDYGAVGDGVTNDAAAFNAALAANLEVTVPANTYALGATVTVPSGKRLVGAGRDTVTLLRRTGFTASPMIAVNGTLEGATVDGNWPTVNGGWELNVGVNGRLSGIRWQHAYDGVGSLSSGARVADSEFIGAGSPTIGAFWGFWFDSPGLVDIAIERSTFRDIRGNAIFGRANGLLIDGSDFYDNHRQIVPTGGGQIAIVNDARNVVINSSRLHPTTGGGAGFEIDSVDGITISNTEVYGQTGSGIVLQTVNVHNVTIVNTHVHDCGIYGIDTPGVVIDNLTLANSKFENNAAGVNIQAENLFTQMPGAPGPILAALQMDRRWASVSLL